MTARQGEPTDFDNRGCCAVLALTVCFWIAVGMMVWGVS